MIRVRPRLAACALSPGTIDNRGYVAVQDGFIEILGIKPASGRSMSWTDYVNGRRVKEGDRFLTPST